MPSVIYKMGIMVYLPNRVVRVVNTVNIKCLQKAQQCLLCNKSSKCWPQLYWGGSEWWDREELGEDLDDSIWPLPSHPETGSRGFSSAQASCCYWGNIFLWADEIWAVADLNRLLLPLVHPGAGVCRQEPWGALSRKGAQLQ